MDDRQPGDAPTPAPTPPPPSPRALLPRWLALLQALIVCGIPTQLVVAVALVLIFRMPLNSENLSLEFFATLSFVDTALVVLLIRWFLAHSGETSAAVFLGSRLWRREVLRGLLLLPVTFLGVSAIVLGLRTVAPWMHSVEENPLEHFMQSPIEAAVFLVVVVLAGGVREEIQRAFILHRFEQRLGGARLGLVIFSVVFGALHIEQGYDAAAGIGLLGLLWGSLYLWRRSVVAPMVNHASFNAAQVVQGLLVKAFGG